VGYNDNKPRTKWEDKPGTTIQLRPENRDCLHTTEKETLIQSYLDFVHQCLPGDEYQIPTDWLTEKDSLRNTADLEVRKRNPKLRVWPSGENHLVCKINVSGEPPPYHRPPSSNRFRKSSTKRIETMWSPEDGWCRWDSGKQDYVPDPSLNPRGIE